MVDAESAPLEQVVKQLDKLINVVEIRDLDPSESVERELMMVIVNGQPDERGQIMDLVRIFEARVLNVGGDKMMLSLSGAPSRLDDFEDLLRPYGIVELQRTRPHRSAPTVQDVVIWSSCTRRDSSDTVGFSDLANLDEDNFFLNFCSEHFGAIHSADPSTFVLEHGYDICSEDGSRSVSAVRTCCQISTSATTGLAVILVFRRLVYTISDLHALQRIGSIRTA